MKLKHFGWIGLGWMSAIAIALAGYSPLVSTLAGVGHDTAAIAVAQSPLAAPKTVPQAGPKTASPPAVPSPAGTPSPRTSAAPTTPPSDFLQVPVSPSSVPSPIAPPASTAPPLPLSGTYKDPSGRFRIGILKGFTVSPLAGSVLIESPDGNLAYTVVPQTQPLGNPIGLSAGYDNSDSLAKVAASVFQRGEGFQPSPPQAEAGGGAVINWSGSLTIAGKTQPIGGVIVVRPSSQIILLLNITATQAGATQVPSAVAALTNSLQAL